MNSPTPDLVPLGRIEFDLGAARVERMHWVGAFGGRVVRQLILQREHLPAPDRYNWQVEHPVVVRGVEWECGVYAWSVAEFTAEAGAEVARTAAFLAELGYAQGDSQLMARYARVLGAHRDRELIVFYQEDLAEMGHSADEVADAAGELLPEFQQLGDGILTRSRAAFGLLAEELAGA